MQDYVGWVALFLSVFVPVCFFALRAFLAAWIKEGVRSDFETSLERLRNDFRRAEEQLRSDLRDREAEIASIRAGALEGRAKRQATIASRRIESLERIWEKFTKAGSLKFSALMFGQIDMEKVEQTSHIDENLRQMIELMAGADPTETLKEISGGAERMYVPDLVWATYQAYLSILLTSWAHLKAVAAGIEKAGKLIKWEKVSEVTKAVLPHQSDFIDKYGPSGLPHLLQEMEEKMFSEVMAALNGSEQDAEAIAQSAEILKRVRQVMPEANVGS